MPDDNLRSNLKDYSADYQPAPGNIIPAQTFTADNSPAVPFNQSVTDAAAANAEEMLRKVGEGQVLVESDNDDSYEQARLRHNRLFGRSIAQVFAISAILVTAVIGAAAAGVLTVKHQEVKPGDSTKVIASLKNSPNQPSQEPGLANASILINRDTILDNGSSFTATGDVLVQSDVNSAKAFRVQNAAGDNLLVADTAKGTVTVSGSLVSTGNLQVGSQLISSTGAFSLSGQGLSIGGVLVCTSAGCKPNVAIPDTSSFATLAGNNTFTGVNRFTSAGNVFVGDGSGW